MSPQSLIGDRFLLGYKIRPNSCHDIYHGLDTLTCGLGKTVIIRLEPRVQLQPCLYQEINDLQLTPPILWSGNYDRYYATVFEATGLTHLDALFQDDRGFFSQQNIVDIVKQIINMLKTLHSNGFVHRDIKPDCFLINKETKKIYFEDFGLAARFNIKTTPIKTYKYVGTLRFSSLNSHHGIELRPQDDIESLFYMLIYLSKGKLPWQGIACYDQDFKKVIYKSKLETTVENLCEELSTDFIELGNYIRSCTAVDYEYIHQLLDKIRQSSEDTNEIIESIEIIESNEIQKSNEIQESDEIPVPIEDMKVVTNNADIGWLNSILSYMR